MTISEMFYNCAYDMQYETIGHDVNYAFRNEGSTLYIYFEGSSSTTDWIRNFLFGKRPYKDMKIPYKVHRGFLAAWKEVEDVVIAKVTEKKDDAQNEFKWQKIFVIGYSHGGALAGLCHECVWFWRPDLRENGLEGYGFEAPRFYAGYFVKKALKERWATFKVIRDNNDIVTHCPPWLFCFCHVGSIMKIHGDTSLVEKRMPKCVKSHYPQVVYDGLLKEENK